MWERLEGETSNLASRFIKRGTNERNKKIRSKGVKKGPRELLLKFWDPSISRERLVLQTSNLVCRFITKGTKDKNAKLGQKGSGRDHVTTFEILGPSPHVGTVGARNVKYGKQIHHQDTNERNAKLCQRGSERSHVTYF